MHTFHAQTGHTTCDWNQLKTNASLEQEGLATALQFGRPKSHLRQVKDWNSRNRARAHKRISNLAVKFCIPNPLGRARMPGASTAATFNKINNRKCSACNAGCIFGLAAQTCAIVIGTSDILSHTMVALLFSLPGIICRIRTMLLCAALLDNTC
jgi:hypothetical protein